MERMLKNGTITNINIQYPGDGSTALMYQAGCYGTKAAMEWLLNNLLLMFTSSAKAKLLCLCI